MQLLTVVVLPRRRHRLPFLPSTTATTLPSLSSSSKGQRSHDDGGFGMVPPMSAPIVPIRNNCSSTARLCHPSRMPHFQHHPPPVVRTTTIPPNFFLHSFG